MLTLVAAAVPKHAFAQDARRIEVAGGYSYMQDYDGEATFPRGWFASIAADVAGPVAIVGEATGNYKSMGGLDIDLSMNSHTFMAGPRLFWRSDRVEPYVQMLFGVARMATTYELPEESLSTARSNFAMSPGAGIDIPFSERGALRVGAAVRFIRAETFTATGSEPFTFREFQFVAGVVLR